MSKLDYDYEHIVIDNHSNDGTISILKKIAASKKLHAEILDINWYDVGNVETLKKLNN
mgnify:CR=1 FL=1